MRYPEFFDWAPTIDMVDELAALLGSTEEGKMSFTYLDVVKASGHSCPTVAAAYGIMVRVLPLLFPNETPMRGKIIIECAAMHDEGAIGVMGKVFSHITGAAGEEGFKGVFGHFDRRHLLRFGVDLGGATMRIRRSDTTTAYRIWLDLSVVSLDPRQGELLTLLLDGEGGERESFEFQTLWQQRVKEILIDRINDTTMLRIEEEVK